MKKDISKFLGKNVRGQNVRFLMALIAAIFIFVASDDKTCADLKVYGWVNVNNNTFLGVRVYFVGSGLSPASVEVIPMLSNQIELEDGTYVYSAFGKNLTNNLIEKFSYGSVRVIGGLTSNLAINF